MISVRKEVLYNILIQFGVPMKLVRLIKMCLNETYSKFHIGKLLSDSFPIQDDLKQGDALSPLHFKKNNILFLCVGGIEYLHHIPASHKRRRKGNSVPRGV
jgi:hypothetical protein